MELFFIKYTCSINAMQLLNKCMSLSNSKSQPIFINIVNSFNCTEECINSILLNGTIPFEFNYQSSTANVLGIWNCLEFITANYTVVLYSAGHKKILYMSAYT